MLPLCAKFKARVAEMEARAEEITNCNKVQKLRDSIMARIEKLEARVDQALGKEKGRIISKAQKTAGKVELLAKELKKLRKKC